jgi:hypothetical protein
MRTFSEHFFTATGSESDQFNYPNDIAFDNQGNLYMNDQNNNRIQIFALIDNRPCSSASTDKISFILIPSMLLPLFKNNYKKNSFSLKNASL